MVRTVSVDEYLALEQKHHDWVIPGYVPKPGLVLLIGEPKAGKTSLAIQLALTLGRGEPFLGIPTKPASVLYVQCDTSDLVWRTMLYNYKKAGVNLAGNTRFIHPADQKYGLNIMTPEVTQYFREALEHSKPSVVILDVLRELHSSDEQDSTAMKIVVNHIMGIFEGTSVIMLHHTRKLDPTVAVSPINASRGTSYIPGRADSIWLLHQSRLYVTGRMAPATVRQLKRLPSGLWGVAT